MRFVFAAMWLFIAATAFVVPWLVAVLAGLPPQGGENAGLFAVLVLGAGLVVLLLVRTATVHDRTVSFEAPPERVYALLADPRNHVRWTPPLASVELAGEPGAAGSRYVARAHGGQTQHGEVLAADPPGRIVLRLRVGRGPRAVETEVHRRFVATSAGTDVHSRRIIRCSAFGQLLLRLQATVIENQLRWTDDRMRDELGRTMAATGGR